MKVEWIVWHTAAHGDPEKGIDYDTTAEQIRQWHKAKGWADIGYHFVIRKDGTIERGRPETQPGAHVRGLNHQSIGICFSGHGDISPLTDAQLEAGIRLTVKLLKQHGLPYTRVIGHREVNRLVALGWLSADYRVAKTCPGTKVDMRAVRRRIRQELGDGNAGERDSA